ERIPNLARTRPGWNCGHCATRRRPGEPVMASRVPDVDRVAASRAAVAARRARAAVKDDLAIRVRSPLDVARAAWSEPASAEAGLRVRELIGALPGMGPVRTAKVLQQLGIAESKRVGGLGVRQRQALLKWLSARENVPIPPRRARLVVLAGPTAVGKGAVSGYIREHYPGV